MPFTFTPPSSSESANAQSQGGFQASFGSQASQLLSARPGEENSFSLLQLALFGIGGFTFLIALGLFSYSFFLSSQVENKKEKLVSIENSLNQLPLNEMRQVSNRIKIIEQLVKDHPSVNVAFSILEASIENQAFYKGFDLRYSDSNKGYTLQLNAVAPNYRVVAQQIDTFKREPFSKYVSKMTLDSLGPDEQGRITFSLRMPVSITGILTEELVLSEELTTEETMQQAMQPFATTTQPSVGVPDGTTAAPMAPPAGFIPPGAPQMQ